MNLESLGSTSRARAYPGSDALHGPPHVMRNGQGVSQYPRLRLKKQVEKTKKQNKKVNNLRIGTWNVGTLTGKGREIADVMERRKVRILCIQETKWKGKSAKILGNGYKLYYAGESNRRNGIGIILDEPLSKNVIKVDRINDRLLCIKLGFRGKIVNIMSAYAPQQGSDDNEKEAFRDAMCEYIRNIQNSETILVGGDLNCHVGENADGFEDVHGGRGYGARNEEGERMLEMLEGLDLFAANTGFQKRKHHLITYKSGQHETQIDYILTRKRDRKAIMDSKVIPGECAVAQHRLLVMDLRIGRDRKRKESVVKKVKIWNLKGEKKLEYKTKVAEYRENWQSEREIEGEQDREGKWNEMKNILPKVAMEVCGMTGGRMHQDRETWWWNEAVQGAIKEKKLARRASDASPGDVRARERYKEANKLAKKAVAQSRSEASKPLYEKLGTPEGEQMIYRISKARERRRRDVEECYYIKDKHQNILIEDENIRKRWKEYFEELLNVENERGLLEEALPTLGPIENITLDEVNAAIQSMKLNKASGPTGVVIEMIKALDEAGIEWMWELLETSWKEEGMPFDWEESEMVYIYKQKGDAMECSNYRGIKLMEHALKVFERVIVSKLRKIVNIHEMQFGFMPGKSTVDAIFITRQVQEKFLEGNRKLYWCFVDLEKAFDRVPREVMYWCLRKRGVPERLINMMKMIYKGARTVVRTRSGKTEPFEVKVGLHQGSALSPFLFAVVMDVLSENVRRDMLWDLLFADDLVITAETEEQLQERYRAWQENLERGGLRVNVGKTEVMISSRGGREDLHIRTTAGEELKQTTSFKYLGSVISEEGGCEQEVRQRIKAGWAKWRQVSGVILDKKVPMKLRTKVYKTVIRPVLLYGSETWAMRRKEEGALERTEMRMLRWILGISLLERIESEDIRKRAGVCKITDKACESRMRWYGHVVRRDENNLIRKAKDMAVEGRRSRGRQRIRWTDVVERDMKGMGLEQAEALDRNLWRRKTRAADPIGRWD